MALLPNRRSDLPIDSHYREFTITEILSDSIVKAVMKADGVDPGALEAQLRSMALAMPESDPEEAQRLVACRTSTAAAPCMVD
jgi:hypothetical protein